MKTPETPNTIHGRLLEAVHISGYTFERACSELEWLLEQDRWKEVGRGFDDINTFLATLDLSGFRIVVERRQKLAKKLEAIEASQRATARALGVDHRTIGHDLAGENSPPPDPAHAAPSLPAGENSPPESFVQASGREVAEEAEAKREAEARRRATDEKREQERAENQEKVDATSAPEELVGVYSTIVVDPPWDWGDEGDVNQMGRAKPGYASMSIEELRAFPIPKWAASDAHIYLWITNRSLPKGFDLLDAWGFRYITAITWGKPGFGMGNYFRGQTEHLLFGVRGSLGLRRKDVGTWFSAERGPGGHSSKPDEAYALIRSCSPGPRLNVFGRRERDGFVNWGAEVGDAA